MFGRRLCLALGSVPAALTLYFREKMPETPRYTLHKEGNAAKMVADMGTIAQEAGVDTTKTAPTVTDVGSQKRLQAADTDMSFGSFLSKWGLILLGTASCWFYLDVAFYSQNLFQKDLFLQVGWLPPANKMHALAEAEQVSYAQAVIALGSTIPG